MKIEGVNIPKSSFLSVEKDMNLIVDKLLTNQRLKKLLYYTNRDALDLPPINAEQTLDLINNNIKLVPKIKVDDQSLTYLYISCDNFITNPSNLEFRNNTIEFDILCHFDNWQLRDFQLRPYKIAAEIDSMLDKKHLTGIGELQFLGATQIILNDEIGGLCLMYTAIHGEEDKKFMPNPQDEEKFIDEFHDLIKFISDESGLSGLWSNRSPFNYN